MAVKLLENGKWEMRIDPGLGESRVQVFTADTQEELFQKIETAQINATQRIHNLREFVQPDKGSEIPEFRPRTLGADELFRLGTELQDPTKAVKAQEVILEAVLGAKPDQLRDVLRSAHVNRLVEKYKQETAEWLRENPEFHKTPRNHTAMMQWLDAQESTPGNHGIPPSKKNLTLAFNALKEIPGGLPDGLNVEPPARAGEGTNPDDEGEGGTHIESDEERRRIASGSQPTTRQRGPNQSSGLRNGHASAQPGSRGSGQKWTKDQVMAMPEAEYSELYKKSAEFRKFVDGGFK